MDDFNKEVFKGKSFSDLLKEIHKKSNTKSKQIELLIAELRPLVKTIGDATVIVPLIKEYLDVGVKNDELLVKIAVVIQRHLQKTSGSGASGDWEIPQEEIDNLVDEYKANQQKASDTNKKAVEASKSKSKKDDNLNLPTLDDIKTGEEDGDK